VLHILSFLDSIKRIHFCFANLTGWPYQIHLFPNSLNKINFLNKNVFTHLRRFNLSLSLLLLKTNGITTLTIL
jgi:hypothetical protein